MDLRIARYTPNIGLQVKISVDEYRGGKDGVDIRAFGGINLKNIFDELAKLVAIVHRHRLVVTS